MEDREFILHVLTTSNAFAVFFILLLLYFFFLYRQQQVGIRSREDEIWYLIIKLFVMLNVLSILVTLVFFFHRASSTFHFQSTSLENNVQIFQTVFPKAHWCSSTGNTGKECSDVSIAHMMSTNHLSTDSHPQLQFVRFAVDDRLEWLNPANGEFRSREVNSSFSRNLRDTLKFNNSFGFSSFSFKDYFIDPCEFGFDTYYYCEDGFRHGVLFVKDTKGKTLGAAVWFEGGGENFGTLRMAPLVLLIQLMGIPFIFSTLIASPITTYEVFRYVNVYNMTFLIATIISWVLIMYTLVLIMRSFFSNAKSRR